MKFHEKVLRSFFLLWFISRQWFRSLIDIFRIALFCKMSFPLRNCWQIQSFTFLPFAVRLTQSQIRCKRDDTFATSGNNEKIVDFVVTFSSLFCRRVVSRNGCHKKTNQIGRQENGIWTQFSQEIIPLFALQIFVLHLLISTHTERKKKFEIIKCNYQHNL